MNLACEVTDRRLTYMEQRKQVGVSEDGQVGAVGHSDACEFYLRAMKTH